MKPIAEEINKDSAIKFKFIDVDENLDLCRSYNIKSVPTFILIKDKQEIKRAVGAKNKEELREFLNG
jgi:thioredoxin-like negative regulator of GroEL